MALLWLLNQIGQLNYRIATGPGVAEIIRQQRQLAAKLSDVQQELAVTKDELRSSKTELERVCREIAEKEASFDTRWREREAKIATEQETQRQEAMTKAGDMELWQSELNKLRIEASAIRDAISRVRSRSPPGSRKRGGSQRRAKGAVGSGGEDGSASDNPSAASENATSASERETVSETEADTRVKLEKKAHTHDAGTDATAPTLLRPISTNVSSLKGVTSKSSKEARSKSSSSLRRGRTPTREMARDDLDLP